MENVEDDEGGINEDEHMEEQAKTTKRLNRMTTRTTKKLIRKKVTTMLPMTTRIVIPMTRTKKTMMTTFKISKTRPAE